MTMLSLFEEELQAQAERVLDVPCASCSSMGVRMNGDTCSGCGGAGWLQLGDHPEPCQPCNSRLRAERPDPPGLPQNEAEWVTLGDWGLCGLCGSKSGLNQGSSLTGQVCDACAKIDRCDRRDDEGRHVSHWGESHEAHAHDELVRAQAKRRARFLALRSSHDSERSTN